METCPDCSGKGELRLTTAQERVLVAARDIDDWFLASDIDCQYRTLEALVTMRLVEAHLASGGPPEYRAV